MKASTKAIRFLESLSIPEGPKAGEAVKLAPFQKQFVKGEQDNSIEHRRVEEDWFASHRDDRFYQHRTRWRTFDK